MKESYKHKAAKSVLADWLRKDNVVSLEETFGSGDLAFRPDITTYKGKCIQSFCEVVNKCGVNGKTLGKMQYWCYVNKKDLLVHEVSADWILDQRAVPERIIDVNTYNLT